MRELIDGFSCTLNFKAFLGSATRARSAEVVTTVGRFNDLYTGASGSLVAFSALVPFLQSF